MKKPEIISAYVQPVVELDVSDWYRNPEFQNWLVSTGLATWSFPGQNPVEDASEVFLYVERKLHAGDATNAEGSEASTAPEWAWKAIVEACREAVPETPAQRIMVVLQNTNVEPC